MTGALLFSSENFKNQSAHTHIQRDTHSLFKFLNTASPEELTLAPWAIPRTKKICKITRRRSLSFELFFFSVMQAKQVSTDSMTAWWIWQLTHARVCGWACACLFGGFAQARYSVLCCWADIRVYTILRGQSGVVQGVCTINPKLDRVLVFIHTRAWLLEIMILARTVCVILFITTTCWTLRGGTHFSLHASDNRTFYINKFKCIISHPFVHTTRS